MPNDFDGIVVVQNGKEIRIPATILEKVRNGEIAMKDITERKAPSEVKPPKVDKVEIEEKG